MLERLRRRDSKSLGTEHKDADLSPGARGLITGYAFVAVDLEDVRDGTSEEIRTSGPGSPKCGEGIA